MTMLIYAIHNYPMDSRVSIEKSGVVQTLSARMGTGGGQHSTRAHSKGRKRFGARP